jgi:hypothetical protein
MDLETQGWRFLRHSRSPFGPCEQIRRSVS